MAHENLPPPPASGPISFFLTMPIPRLEVEEVEVEEVEEVEVEGVEWRAVSLLPHRVRIRAIGDSLGTIRLGMLSPFSLSSFSHFFSLLSALSCLHFPF